MSFTEIDVFGIYVAPIAPLILATWIISLPLRWGADLIGLSYHVWHPALFNLAIFVILLSSAVLIIGSL